MSSDTKQYLYLDPGRLLERAPYLWDPHVAAGTVPHQNIGYLFPMGPWFWTFQRLGVPDWIAQRFWLGTITFAAALGARWLFTTLGTHRVGALAGALVYALTPYQLAFTARISVLLLPWAGLPWLVGLTIRAVRRGGWRDPALFALVMLVIGGVNASALLLVGVAPALWVLLELYRGRAAARAAIAASARISVLTVGVSLWWIVGLRLQGSYGLPVLQLTENLQTLSRASEPTDLLRGLGNWFFYGQDRFGYSIGQAVYYVTDHPIVFFSYAIPVVGLLAAVVTRWRYRAYFVLLVVMGTVIGVGAWPYDDPTPYGGVWKNFANHSSLGLALRNTPRVVPVIVLGFAGLLAAAIGALSNASSRWRPVSRSQPWRSLPCGPSGRSDTCRPGLPDRRRSRRTGWRRPRRCNGRATRPGSSRFPARPSRRTAGATPSSRSRPGSSIAPTCARGPALRLAPDRQPPRCTRPSHAGGDVRAGIAGFRRPLGRHRHRRRSLGPAVRALPDAPRPRLLWAQLTDPLATGLRRPTGFGPATRNRPLPRFPMLDELELRTPSRRLTHLRWRCSMSRTPFRSFTPRRRRSRSSSTATATVWWTRPPRACSTATSWSANSAR